MSSCFLTIQPIINQFIQPIITNNTNLRWRRSNLRDKSFSGPLLMKKMYMKHNLKNCYSKILRKTSISLHKKKEVVLVIHLKTLGERNILLNFQWIGIVIVISTAILPGMRFNISDEYTCFLFAAKAKIHYWK